MHAFVRSAVIAGFATLSITSFAAAQGFLPPTANLLLRSDTDQDGAVSRLEMEQGVAADYALSDVDTNRCIDNLEMRVEVSFFLIWQREQMVRLIITLVLLRFGNRNAIASTKAIYLLALRDIPFIANSALPD